MGFAQYALAEFDHEMANTRKVLAAIPDGKLHWKPHPKSNTIAWNANHLADLPLWAVSTLTKPGFDFAPADGPKYELPKLTKMSEILALFDKNVAEARKAIEGAKDESLADMWTLRGGERVIFTMPRAAVYRGFVMNHIIHHRAILCVYLRLNDVPVPGLYGPSGDE